MQERRQSKVKKKIIKKKFMARTTTGNVLLAGVYFKVFHDRLCIRNAAFSEHCELHLEESRNSPMGQPLKEKLLKKTPQNAYRPAVPAWHHTAPGCHCPACVILPCCLPSTAHTCNEAWTLVTEPSVWAYCLIQSNTEFQLLSRPQD